MKRKKELICLGCAKREDAEKQIEKSKRKNAAIGIGSRLRCEFEREHRTEAAIQVSKNAALTRWFNDRRKEMTGKCAHCGGKTEKHNDATFKCSIAHILPKAYVKSVATHESNFLELCFYGNSCHSQMDNKNLDLTEMSCWDEIVVKFQKMYPFIIDSEKRRIPDILLQYLNTDI